MKVIRYLWMVIPALLATQVDAARIADIANTKHNLSSTWGGDAADTRTVKAVSETEICVFCHTPHGAQTLTGAPLWNRGLGTSTYTMYDSSSMEAERPTGPSNSSKLCLSCHDGTLAIGAVNVLNGGNTDQNPATEDIDMIGVRSGGRMPNGQGEMTGFTRNLGIDLSNDHPISITYDTTLSTSDGELRDPVAEPHIGVRSSGVRFAIPLVENENDGQAKVECISCHDPHIRDDSGEDIKFLRLNRFQMAAPYGDAFNEENDIICLGCHSKEGWLDSAHANPDVANETYLTPDATTMRGFPDNIPVWRAACLNCHDTHTVQGSRRLLREGTDGRNSGPNTPKTGGYAAIEETCYQCHSNDGGTLNSQGDGTEVPDIKGDFQLPRHMPISTGEQPAGQEMHDIGNTGIAGDGKDFIEKPETLGKGMGNLINRHAECTDCHNPHRVIKNDLASDNPYYFESAGTHKHTGSIHNNLASGVLRGAWGVEPQYTSRSFHDAPSSFDVKRGVPQMNVDMSGDPDTYSYVTREYQICLKCHSNYAFEDNNTPILGSFNGGTPIGTNGATRYTNQAKEFQAPINHKGEPVSAGWDGGACGSQSNMNNNNHRSWHPVMDNTGRDAYSRGKMTPDSFLPPWNMGIGSQTMFCSDCHGSNTSTTTSEPDGGVNGNPWGPHGSENNFILKGRWIENEMGVVDPGKICFKCHDRDAYGNADAAAELNGRVYAKSSGFQMALGPGYDAKMGGEIDNNLHIGHAYVLKYKYGTNNFKCNWCHVAVPHGWKNKAFLASSTDLGPEAGLSTCTNTWDRGPDGPTTRPPYYYNFIPLLTSFAPSGAWTVGYCQGITNMQNLCTSPP